MENTNTNLATQPQLNRRQSRLRIVAVVGLSLILIGLGTWRLGIFLSQQRSLRDGAAGLRQRQETARRQTQDAEKTILNQKKIWKDRIDWANDMIESLSPVIIRHLDHLESLLPDQVRLESLQFERSSKGELKLTVSAATTATLFELYRRLAEYDLHVSSESPQKEGGYAATLSIALSAGEGGRP
jgi:cell division protein FtsB